MNPLQQMLENLLNLINLKFDYNNGRINDVKLNIHSKDEKLQIDAGKNIDNSFSFNLIKK